jgi:hypothetical protein
MIEGTRVVISTGKRYDQQARRAYAHGAVSNAAGVHWQAGACVDVIKQGSGTAAGRQTLRQRWNAVVSCDVCTHAPTSVRVGERGEPCGEPRAPDDGFLGDPCDGAFTWCAALKDCDTRSPLRRPLRCIALALLCALWSALMTLVWNP